MNILLRAAIIIAVIAVVSFSMNWSPYQETRPFKKVWYWLPVFAFASGAVAVDDIFVRSTLVIASVFFVFCTHNLEWTTRLFEKYLLQMLVTIIFGLGICWIVWPMDILHDNDALSLSASVLLLFSLVGVVVTRELIRWK